MKRQRDAILRNSRPTRQDRLDSSTEREKLLTLQEIRSIIYEQHIRMSALIDKAKSNSEDIEYFNRYTEIADSQINHILKYNIEWLVKEASIRQQQKESSSGSSGNQGGRG